MIDSLIVIATAVVTGALGIGSGLHALLRKRDPRSQLLWMLACWFVPIGGAITYWFLGVNRIQTRARKWQAHGRFDGGRAELATTEEERLSQPLSELPNNMSLLAESSARVTETPLFRGNAVDPLYDGEEAYPAMLEAIDQAQRYVFLSSYIFEADAAGTLFVDALIRAGARGVDVRVLVDAIGEKYSKPRIGTLLTGKPGVRFERFLPLSLSWRLFRVNLRNHRKLLIVDGSVGFTGGMNISHRHMVRDLNNANPTADMHYRFTGPAVCSLEEVFSEDWCFRVGEDRWPQLQPPPPTAGQALCRGIKDGPNEDLEKLQWVLIAAITGACKHVRILTPYFIPSRELMAALHTAVLRGAKVEIILPRKSNLPVVDWATSAILSFVLKYDIEVYHQPAPFNHSKLLLVDDHYINIGSANLDPRSLRLNFEFNMEIYDSDLAAGLHKHFETLRMKSTRVTSMQLQQRHLLIRLRDATAKLGSHYL